MSLMSITSLWSFLFGFIIGVIVGVIYVGEKIKRKITKVFDVWK